MRRFAIGIALGALCAGCGGSDAPTADPAAAADEFRSEGENRAPVIESVRLDPAEPAQGATVRAVVTARDPDGQRVALAHRWFVDGDEQRTDEPEFVLEGVDRGAEIRVVVTASDGALESEAWEAAASVIDRPPTITSTAIAPEGSVAPGQAVSVRVLAGDPDGDPVDFEYTWFVNDEPRQDDSGSVLDTEGLASGDRLYAEVRATDGTNWTEPERTPTVTVGGSFPEITSTPPGFREDGVFRYEVVAVDPDGDKRLRYRLEQGPTGMAVDDVYGELVWRPSQKQHGVHPVVVVVRDSSGLETKQSFSVTVREDVSKSDASAPAKAADAEKASDEPDAADSGAEAQE
jgi:hypothetical protein